jgi:predicted DCC family thiol-disulfide oxidoreductase YuxK
MNLLHVFTTLLLLINSVGGFEAKPILRRNGIGRTKQSATVGTEINSPNLYDAATISSRVFAADKRPVILFDGVCNMCNSAVNLALDWDPKGKLRFSALQSNVGRALLKAHGRNADDISTIVLVTSDGAFIKSDAVLKITEELTPFSLLPLKPAAALGRMFVPKMLRDIIYDGVADNRYSVMGKRDECRLDSDGEFENRFVDDRIAVKVD